MRNTMYDLNGRPPSSPAPAAAGVLDQIDRPVNCTGCR